MDLREDSFAGGLRQTFEEVVQYLSDGLQIVQETYQEKVNPSFRFFSNEGFDVMRATMSRGQAPTPQMHSRTTAQEMSQQISNDPLDAIFPGASGNREQQPARYQAPTAAENALYPAQTASAPVAQSYATAPQRTLPNVDFGFGLMGPAQNTTAAPVAQPAQEFQSVLASTSNTAAATGTAAASVETPETQNFSDHLVNRHAHNKEAMKSALEASMALQNQLKEDQAARDKMQADYIRAARSPLAAWRRPGATNANNGARAYHRAMSDPRAHTGMTANTRPSHGLDFGNRQRPAAAAPRYEQPTVEQAPEPGWIQSSSPYRSRRAQQKPQQPVQQEQVKPKAQPRMEAPEEQSMKTLFESYQHLNRSMDRLLYGYFHTDQD